YRLSYTALKHNNLKHNNDPGGPGACPRPGSGGWAPSVIASDTGLRCPQTQPTQSRAPIRNRTVDLLLTMETLCRLSYWGAARATQLYTSPPGVGKPG